MPNFYFYTPKNRDNEFLSIPNESMTVGLLNTIRESISESDLNVIIVDSPVLDDSTKRSDFSYTLHNWLREGKLNYRPFLIVLNEKSENIDKTFFDNSNIWFRIAYCVDLQNDISKAISDFNTCDSISLYTQNSAVEYIDYQLRIQKENYLNKNHKNYVFPNLYASENIALDENIELNPELKGKVYFRILLIDDKLGYEQTDDSAQDDSCTDCNKIIKTIENSRQIVSIKKGCHCDTSKKTDCKLRIIKELLGNIKEEDKSKVYWKTNPVKAYYFNAKVDNNLPVEFNLQQFHSECDSVQIIGVKSVDTAIAFLKSNIKFDIILLDYLLDKKADGSEREYGVKFLKSISSENTQNAGLENRFWIFSITAFAPAFLNHLQCEGISLLTNKWYIYPPTNPIVTPVRFLRNLNEFISMMVDRSVV